MRNRVPLLACAGVLATAGCAVPPGGPAPQLAQSRAPQCFRANEVYGYTQGPDGVVDIKTASGPFRMRLGPGCPDFSWIMQIGVRPVESPWLCEGRSDELITAFQTPFSRCTVTDVQAMSPAPMPA